jgi:hypothetical protein
MNSGITNDDFDIIRKAIVPLSEEIEIDDPQQGLLARVKVSGGVFVHPLSREAIDVLRVYAAGQNHVKIIEPNFLRSLPLINIQEFTHPSHLCAQIAKQLSDILGQLGKIRDQVAAMGIELDLEHDILRLRGRLELQDYQLELTIWQPGKLVICKLNTHELAGALPRPERTLELTDQATADLDELAKLARGIDDKFRSQVFEDMGNELGVWGQPAAKQPEPTAEQLQPVAKPPEPAVKPPEPTAQQLQPPAEMGQSDGEKNVIEEIAASSPDFTKGFTEVLELTEEVEEEPVPLEPASLEPTKLEPAPIEPTPLEPKPLEPTPLEPTPLEPTPLEPTPLEPTPLEPTLLEPTPLEPTPLEPTPLEPTPHEPAAAAWPPEPEPEKAAAPPVPPAKDAAPAAEPSFGPISVESIFEKLGSDARVSAYGGRLRIEVPVKIIQGTYVFYLEQRGPKTFKGYISTPSGARHNVEFDLRAIMELSDVLERVLLGH